LNFIIIFDIVLTSHIGIFKLKGKHILGGYYLGIDQGTTGTAALIFDSDWRMLSRGYREIKQYYPNPGWVEHSASEIWDSVCVAVSEATNTAGISLGEVICLGIDHEGESVVIWDERTGVPIANTIVWQDRRTSDYAAELEEEHGERIREITGLYPDAYFSATKLKWLVENTAGARDLMKSGQLLAGTMDTWIIWKMTHGRVFITDASTASRTMLYDIGKGDWSDEILELLGINELKLPEVRDSFEAYGSTDPLSFLGASVPISGVLVDQQAALLGQGCITSGSVKTTYGTGCFMLMNIGEKPILPENGILNTVAWQVGGKRTYALDGGVYVAGAAIQWLRDGIKIIDNAKETEAMAIRAGGNQGLYFVPAFTGLAAPHWDSYARGTMIGLTAGINRDHIARATLEAIAYQVGDVLTAMTECSGSPFRVMRADGGATANNFLMQFQSNILGIPIDIPINAETSALGAAYAAALGAGEISGLEEIAGSWEAARHFEPQISEDERATLLHGWHRAVERAKNWIE
jgi:glycerol kinase